MRGKGGLGFLGEVCGFWFFFEKVGNFFLVGALGLQLVIILGGWDCNCR